VTGALDICADVDNYCWYISPPLSPHTHTVVHHWIGSGNMFFLWQSHCFFLLTQVMKRHWQTFRGGCGCRTPWGGERATSGCVDCM